MIVPTNKYFVRNVRATYVVALHNDGSQWSSKVYDMRSLNSCVKRVRPFLVQQQACESLKWHRPEEGGERTTRPR